MKTFLQRFLIIFLLFNFSTLHSQVANYTFSETTGTYTSIVGGTQLVTTTGGATTFDTDGNNISLPVGSRFTFNGVTITSLNMTADGALWLNPASTTTGNGTTGPISSAGVAVGVISAMGMDLRSTALASQVYERRWQDVGTEVVFQWQNAARYLQSSTERFSFQVRINKSTGVIQVVYGNMTTIANSTTYQPMVGLRGSVNTDYNNRRLTTTIPDATPNWGAPNGTIAGTSNAHTVRFTSAGTCFPTSGLTFVWTPPSCLAPTSLTITYTSPTSANLSWTAPTSAPSNGYQWEIRTSGLGGSGATGLVASGSVGAGVTTASTSSLAGNTTYILYVRSNCGGTFSAWSASASSTSPIVAPTNDNCSSATLLPCATSGLAGTTIGSVSETAPLGYSSPFGVWYSFVGDGNQTTITSVAGTGFDHEMTIMSGTTCGATYTAITSQDVGFSGGTETYTFTTTNGTQYYIYIAYYSTTGTASNTGTFTITRTCTTPCNTTASTIAVNLSNTVTNDVVTYTVTGGNGTITGYQFSYNNFTTIDGTITTTSNPWNLRLNTSNPIIYVRAITQNGTCNSTTSNIVSTTIRCATPSVYSTQYGDYITNVTFNTINNTTTSDVGGDGYQNFLSISTDVCRGLPYSISVSGTNAGAFLGFRVWIDYNNDNDFDDVGESVFSSSPISTATGTITIPNTATLGNVKMRVMGIYNTTPSTTPCSTISYDYGEVEEYTLNIGTFTLATPLVNTDMVFVGRTSTAFNTTTNWLQFNGTNYNLATSAPNSAINIIIPATQVCMTRPLTIAANSIAEVRSATIETSGELRINGTLSVFKDFYNYGLVTNTNTTSQRILEFVGSQTQDVLVMQGNTTLYNLRVNKPSGELRLDNNISITNNLDLPSGFLNLNQKTIDLGTTGFLSNEGTNHSTYCDCSQSYVQSTSTIGSNVTTNPGNIGLEITTNGNQMGTTIIRRRHQRAGSTSINLLHTTKPSVYRIFEVLPQFNGTDYPPNGLNVTLNFNYLEHEIGPEINTEELTFTLWRSGNQGTLWEEKGGTIDATNNIVTLTNFPQFSWVSVGPTKATLPLDLISFNGENKGEYNKLNWVTENEINVSHFILEKSSNGVDFETYTTTPSYGIPSVRNLYTIDDVNPYPNATYYMLTSVDIDGTTSKSNVIALYSENKIQSGTIYPNPVLENVNYKFESEKEDKIEVKLIDIVGKVVLKKQYDISVGLNTITIDLKEFQSGNYTILITHQSYGVTNSTKIIKM